MKILSDESKLNKHVLISILETLRKPNGNKPRNGKINPDIKLKTFADVVSDKWEDLEIEGPSNPKLLELMIITAVENVCGDWEQEKKTSRVNAKIRDATLLSFGLLDKCPHTQNGVNVWLRDRYENYLDSPDFDFMTLEYYEKGTYQQIKKRTKKGKQSLPLNQLTSLSGKGKEAIAPELLKIIQNKIYKQYLDENGNVIAFDLPIPCYTLDNFAPVKKSDDHKEEENTQGIESTLEEGKTTTQSGNIEKKETVTQQDKVVYVLKSIASNMFQKWKTTKNVLLYFLISIACIVVIVLMPLALYLQERHQKKTDAELAYIIKEAYKITPEEIKIINKNILLRPGEDSYLKIKTTPYMELHELSYYSMDDDVVRLENLHNPHIIAAKNVRGEAETTILVHGAGDSIAKDTATVIVRDSSVSSLLKGRNEISSDDFE